MSGAYWFLLVPAVFQQAMLPSLLIPPKCSLASGQLTLHPPNPEHELSTESTLLPECSLTSGQLTLQPPNL